VFENSKYPPMDHKEGGIAIQLLRELLGTAKGKEKKGIVRSDPILGGIKLRNGRVKKRPRTRGAARMCFEKREENPNCYRSTMRPGPKRSGAV